MLKCAVGNHTCNRAYKIRQEVYNTKGELWYQFDALFCLRHLIKETLVQKRWNAMEQKAGSRSRDVLRLDTIRRIAAR